MPKPIRLLIYLAIIGFSGYMLAPALSINTGKIGEPIRELLSSLNILASTGIIFGLALLITYLIRSGFGLVILGSIALVDMIVLAILHPYFMPLLIPMFAVWMVCAVARRKQEEAH